MKQTLAFLLVVLLAAGSMSCAKSSQQTGKGAFVFITKAEGNPYNDCTAQGYAEVMEAQGQPCVIMNPKQATAEAQISIIREMTSKNVAAITVAANDRDALQESLQAAMRAGIVVTSMDSATNASSRATFVNQATTQSVGEALVEAVYDLCDGEGQWAILSATSQAANQNAWIDAMKQVLEQPKYAKLRLVDIAYGNDVYADSVVATQALLEQHPKLKVICAPTAAGLPAVASTVRQADSAVKVTGLGLPSDMAQYVSDLPDATCPYLYLWDPFDLGRLSAYVTLALADKQISGAAGDVFAAGEMGEYTLRKALDGGTEVILAPPLRIDASNIQQLKLLY